MKKFLTVILTLALLFGCTSCNGNAAPARTPKETDLTFWSAPATEKIMQDRTDIYDAVKGEASISVTAARGEYESAQLILTASEEVKEYDVVLSDLTARDSEAVFSKDNILLYNEKYILVASNYEGNGAPTGMYPDAILPFETAKAYGENRVSKGENQGLYITFDVKTDQAAGVYTGAFEITYGSFVKKIPVTLTVADFTVSETNHAKSIFLNQWQFEKGELNSTQEMLNAYTEKLIEYRLAPDKIVTDTRHSDEDIAYFTELAYRYLQDPRLSNLSIPYATKWLDGQLCIDPVVLDKYLTALAEKSFETGQNLLAKAVCYFGIIDEPQLGGLLARVKVVSKYFHRQLEETADRIAADPQVTSPLKSAVVDSIRAIKNVVTCNYIDEIADSVETWCPKIQYYDTDTSRANYDEQEEKWWYTCVDPRAPKPSYHLEDSLLSARSMGWMQAEYGVVGNLFWATNVYARYDGENYQDIEDYYGNAERFPNVNGDGYLFYAGKQYGLDEPVASLRLEAIRDGLEEYEILLALQKEYEAVKEESGYAFDTTMAVKALSSTLYSGTTMTNYDAANFAAARASLFQLAELAGSPAKFSLVDVTDDGYGTVEYKAYVKDGYTLKNNGLECLDYTAVRGGKIYSVVTELTDAENTLELSVEIGGRTLYYTQDLGGRAVVYGADAADTEADFGKEDVMPAVRKIPANTLDETLAGNMLLVGLPATAAGSAQSFRVSGGLLSGLGRTNDRLVMHVYLPDGGGTELPFVVSAKNSKSKLYADLATLTLRAGMNTVEIPLGSRNWDKLGDIEYLIFYTGDKQAQPGRELGLYDFVVYDK